MAHHKLQTPLSEADIRKLQLEDTVSIDGTIYQDAYAAKLGPDSEIYLIPKIGGG